MGKLWSLRDLCGASELYYESTVDVKGEPHDSGLAIGSCEKPQEQTDLAECG